MHRFQFILSLLILASISISGYFAYENIDTFQSFGKPIRYEAPPVVFTPTTSMKDIEKEPIETVGSTTPDENAGILTEDSSVQATSETNTVDVVVESAPDVSTSYLALTKDPIFGEVNTKTRKALVNIFCSTPSSGGSVTLTSGSGIVIDPKGVILTNAHIAQAYLTKDVPTPDFRTCTVRTGLAATDTYTADLLYLPPTWVQDNIEQFKAAVPTGTGEDDYAFLIITGTTNGDPLPNTFPFVRPEIASAKERANERVLVGAYPAELIGRFLLNTSIQNSLYLSTELTSSFEVDNLNSNDTEIVTLSDTRLAQQGSSGGAVVSEDTTVIALVSGASEEADVNERSIRAISLFHINDSLVRNNETTLDELLSGDVYAKAKAFMTLNAPVLRDIITDVTGIPEAPPPPKPEKPKVSFGESNTKTRDALVNIVCETRNIHGGDTIAMSSGVIIDQKGVILTTAHSGQYALYQDSETVGRATCTARTGNPTNTTYTITPLYLSKKWVSENNDFLSSAAPQLTGEDDYMLFLITGRVSGSSLPDSFSSVPFDTEKDAFGRDEQKLVGAYPVGKLGLFIANKGLDIATAVVDVTDIVTFGDNTPDALSLSGSIVAQSGSNGGAIINEHGDLSAIVLTSTGEANTNSRTMWGITLSHINTSFQNETGESLADFLSGDLTEKAAQFNTETAPSLRDTIILPQIN